MPDGLYHAHKRKISQADLRETNLLKRSLDKAVYPIALLNPLFSLAQAGTILMERNAGGVSIVLWFVFFLSSIFWIFYGSIHKERAIVFANIVMLLASSSILVEIVLFS